MIRKLSGEPKAKQSKAKQSRFFRNFKKAEAKQSKAKWVFKTSKLGVKAKQSKAKQSEAKQNGNPGCGPGAASIESIGTGLMK